MLADRENVRSNFYLDKDILYFNAGTFGVCPKPVLEEKIKFLRKIEANPVNGHVESMFETSLENIKELGKRIGVEFENLAFLQNVTQGFSSVLTSIDIKAGDEILITNFTYGAIVMEVEKYFVEKGGSVKKLILEFPFPSNEYIINKYKDFAESNSRIKYAIIDHIPSTLPMVQPVKEIVKALQSLGIYVIIDGAHAPGQLPNLNVADIGADVYLGNLHKWCFLPRGVAFLAVHPSCKFQIRPIVVSWLHNSSLFERFLFPGTVDFTNILCIKSAFQFIDSLGGLEAISNYNSELLKRGIKYLEESWGVAAIAFPEMAPAMRVIPFPPGFDKHSDKIALLLKRPFEKPYYKFTLRKFGFILSAYSVNGKLYFRFCSQIFMEFEYFKLVSEKILKWLEMLDNDKDL